jgi:hypothetical protein
MGDVWRRRYYIFKMEEITELEHDPPIDLESEASLAVLGDFSNTEPIDDVQLD